MVIHIDLTIVNGENENASKFNFIDCDNYYVAADHHKPHGSH